MASFKDLLKEIVIKSIPDISKEEAEKLGEKFWNCGYRGELYHVFDLLKAPEQEQIYIMEHFNLYLKECKTLEFKPSYNHFINIINEVNSR